jgi:hypothetical protein
MKQVENTLGIDSLLCIQHANLNRATPNNAPNVTLRNAVSEADKYAIFVRVLNGETLIAVALDYGITQQTAHNIIYYAVFRLQYLSGQIDLITYCTSITKKTVRLHAIPLENLREQKQKWFDLHNDFDNCVLTKDSLLIYTNIDASKIKALSDIGICTVGQFIDNEQTLLTLKGFGPKVIKSVNACVAHLLQ